MTAGGSEVDPGLGVAGSAVEAADSGAGHWLQSGWTSLVFLVWAMGASALLVWFLMTGLYVRRVLRDAEPVDGETFPLLLVSHGFGNTPGALVGLTRQPRGEQLDVGVRPDLREYLVSGVAGLACLRHVAADEHSENTLESGAVEPQKTEVDRLAELADCLVGAPIERRQRRRSC